MAKKSLDHPDYLIPGTRIANFSKWSRENIPKTPHAIPLGQVVDVDIDDQWAEDGIELSARGTARLIVVGHNSDCDGTALYCVSDKGIAVPEGHRIIDSFQYQGFCRYYRHGIGEEALRPVIGHRVELTLWEDWKRNFTRDR